MLRRELPADHSGPIGLAIFWIAEVDARLTSQAVAAAASLANQPSVWLKRVARGTADPSKSRVLICRQSMASRTEVEQAFKEKGLEGQATVSSLELIDRVPVTQVGWPNADRPGPRHKRLANDGQESA